VTARDPRTDPRPGDGFRWKVDHVVDGWLRTELVPFVERFNGPLKPKRGAEVVRIADPAKEG